ncbi:50S ribosomal protein L25/general stress protein Ctc [Enterococcus sp. BWB1-3]|uniref:50S ribosomal protein L25/general stress protein Ctc n=1 Tax=unclassified Enterococcus TaxID=2608891 RepID=UPI001922EE8F|nr:MULTISPECIES: 50S ribosomal protein L25/general stress protein Ctc [unclassified Enterococcus]MBL1227671.1 50S ribosomal protein L25/general stress protein Ctc [Enterococcus sp. BWB1-3]MCB5952143.1 50S ribosomal protein L25/general stress protein Ctc [Enterococcus sp. BWT-B8]MCB5954450.1 50S ribosomal protein L25/general stress protein Ctc [Enterococcus sp. CWB-B31]
MSVSLEVQKRAVRPRSLRNELRHSGKIPAVVYGYQIESTPITVDEKELTKVLRDNGANTVIALTIDGKKVNTLVYKTQLDTFTGKIKHVEFLAVNMTEETEVEAEVVLVGEAKGVKAGGALTQNLYSVLVSATPENLPERVEVDVAKLAIGDSLTVADLPKNDKFTIVTDGDEQIVNITEAQSNEEEETPGETSEPEVIGEEKE